MTEYSIGTDYH